MKKQKLSHHILLCFLGICISISVNSQVFRDEVYNSKIKSIQFYKTGNNLSNPVIQLLGTDTLTLEFDLLNTSNIDVRYELYLCDKNWNISNLYQSEYIKFFGIQRFDKQNSVNTTTEYVHYQTTFPNQDIQFILSGNYIIQVFNDESNELLFQNRFMVIEHIIKVDANTKQASIVEFMDNYQEVDVFLSPLGFPIPNAENDLSILIMQNGRWDNAITLKKPSHINNDIISYDFEKGNIFLGNSEFHQFNFKSLKNGSEHIQNIVYENNTFYINMNPNEVRMYKPYTSTGDLDGKFVPSHEILNDADFVGDYASVIFTLPYYKQNYDTLEVYVVGGFNQWLLQEENHMKYNEEKAQYETTILLKQGYYDYALAQVSKDKTQINSQEIDGSYFQTENNYEVFIYFYDMQVGYDRIIGYKKINTKK